jgi:serine/threonine-protein kinase
MVNDGHEPGPASFRPAPGQIVGGQFRLEHKLGEGGMGELYLACQLEVDRPVVVKFVHAQLALEQSESESRLRREAQAIAHINHPNVVQLYSFGREGAQPYLVMEYIAGHTLSKELERGAMPPARAVHIAKQIASGLAAAHQRGVVHRDLKPDNVMLSSVGNDRYAVKLVDFGIAKPLEPEGNKLTRTGLVVGTPQYMSPEQIEANIVDARSDLYCFGLILYELLTGSVTFSGSTPYELLSQHVKGQVIPPRRYVQGLAPELEVIVLRCLQKDPAQRFQSAEALHEALCALPAEPSDEDPRSAQLQPRAATTAALNTPPPQAPLGAGASTWRRLLPLGAVALALGALLLFRGQWSPSVGNKLQPAPHAPNPSAPEAPPSVPEVRTGGLVAPPAGPAGRISPPARGEAFTAAVQCLNASAARAYDSFQRYASWVDLSRGPTGHERTVHGLYTLVGGALCPEPRELEGDALGQLLSGYLVAFQALGAVLDKADAYYIASAFKYDDMRLGQSLHPELLRSFRRFATAERALRSELSRRAEVADRELLAQLPADSVEHAFHRLRITAQALTDLALRAPEGLDPGADTAAALDAYVAASAQFKARQAARAADDNPGLMVGMGMLLDAAKAFERKAKPSGQLDPARQPVRVLFANAGRNFVLLLSMSPWMGENTVRLVPLRPPPALLSLPESL